MSQKSSNSSSGTSPSGNSSQAPTPPSGVPTFIPFLQKNNDPIYQKLAAHPASQILTVKTDGFGNWKSGVGGGHQPQVGTPRQTPPSGTAPRGDQQRSPIKTIDPNVTFILMPETKQAIAVPHLGTSPVPGTGPGYHPNYPPTAGQQEMVKWEKTTVTPAGKEYEYFYDYQKNSPSGYTHEHKEMVNVAYQGQPQAPNQMYPHYPMTPNNQQTNVQANPQTTAVAGLPPALASFFQTPATPQFIEAARRRAEEIQRRLNGTGGGRANRGRGGGSGANSGKK